ncbi:hypothetical protein D3C86_2060700 [compost metagenome]
MDLRRVSFNALNWPITRSSAPATWIAWTEVNISLMAPVTWLVASRLAARYFCSQPVDSWASATTTTRGRKTQSVIWASILARI